MRIRKNAKLTPSMIWSTAASPSTPNPPEELMQAHVCVLNRSPWDVPLPVTGNMYRHQSFTSDQENVEDDDTSLTNTTTMNSESLNDDSTQLPATDNSRQSVDSMKLSSDNKKTIVNEDSGNFFLPPTTSVQFHSPSHPAATATAKNDNNDIDDKAIAVAVVANAAAGLTTELPRRRGRPRKPPQSAAMTAGTTSLKPPDYYYYAGFGPRYWGKTTRGPNQKVIRKTPNCNSNKNDDKHARININTGTTASSSLSHEIEYYYNNDDDEPVADYIEDDDDDEDDHEVLGTFERKRLRKPIKARSLKSIIS